MLDATSKALRQFLRVYVTGIHMYIVNVIQLKSTQSAGDASNATFIIRTAITWNVPTNEPLYIRFLSETLTRSCVLLPVSSSTTVVGVGTGPTSEKYGDIRTDIVRNQDELLGNIR